MQSAFFKIAFIYIYKGDFKKGTLHVHMNNAGVNGLIFKKLYIYVYM